MHNHSLYWLGVPSDPADLRIQTGPWVYRWGHLLKKDLCHRQCLKKLDNRRFVGPVSDSNPVFFSGFKGRDDGTLDTYGVLNREFRGDDFLCDWRCGDVPLANDWLCAFLH